MANTTQEKIKKPATTRVGKDWRSGQGKYPHLRKAAFRMGYNHTYLYRVLEGRDPHFKGRKGLKEEYWNTAKHIAAEHKQAQKTTRAQSQKNKNHGKQP